MTTRPVPAKPSREQLEAINSSVHYAMFSAFALVTPVGDDDRDAIKTRALHTMLRMLSGLRATSESPAL